MVFLDGCILHLPVRSGIRIKMRGRKKFSVSAKNTDHVCGLRYNSCRCLVGSDSVRQSLSALCASSLEHLSSVSGSHSLSEAVLNLSLTLLRLVCSKHFDTSFKSRLPGEPRQDRGLIQTISRPDSPDPDMTLKLHNNTYYYTRITPGLSRAFRKKNSEIQKIYDLFPV